MPPPQPPPQDAGAGTAHIDGAAGIPKVTVLNPQSHPLVGGFWSVDLEVTGGGGDLTVKAVDGTAFGRDIEFYGMEGPRDSLTPSGRNPLVFDDVADGKWNFTVRVLTDGPHHLEFGFGDGTVSASNTASLANVTSNTDDGTYGPGDDIDVQIGFTEPVTLERFGIRDDGNDTANGTFDVLNGAISIATATIDERHYALVVSRHDDGVQIIDITEPANPISVAAITDGTTYEALNEAQSIATTKIDSNYYALVGSADGLQIINISDPINITASYYSLLVTNPTSIATAKIGSGHYALAASSASNAVEMINMTNPESPTSILLRDGLKYDFDSPTDVTTIQIDSNHYAMVSAFHTYEDPTIPGTAVTGNVQIINMTNPANLTVVTNVVESETIPGLAGVASITTTEINRKHYILGVTIVFSEVQIIDITDLNNPKPVITLTNGAEYNLNNAISITTTEINNKHYALVASLEGNGVQIINITDPTQPSPVSTLTNGMNFPDLGMPVFITTTQIGSNHYALVAASSGDGVQIIDITDPANPFNPLPLPHVSLDLPGERHAEYTGLGNNGTALIFNYTVQDGDYSSDLAYDGTGALRLNGATLKDAGDSTVLTNITLAVPGQPNSLSHNKDIVLSDPDDAFVTTWRTTSANDTITLPVRGSDMTIIWGDGNTTAGVSGATNHTYVDVGDHTVSVTGNLTGFLLYNTDDASKLISIDQWGTAKWPTMKNAFRGASNMEYNATDVPDLSGVTDMRSMFFEATKFNGNISGWNVSSVTDMSGMFFEATAFNQSLDSWTVSSVTDMNGMFFEATAFNQSLDSWIVSSVTDMSFMFSRATAFNQPLDSWNVSSVTDMSSMFSENIFFNGNISSWNVSSVTDMSSMFNQAVSFNQSLDSWDVSSVTDMSSMFYIAFVFNQPIGSWNVSSVDNMSNMFFGTNSFDQNLGGWYVVLDGTTIARNGVPGIVGKILAQNDPLNLQNPIYSITAGLDSSRFEIVSDNQLNMTSVGTKGSYQVNVTSTGDFGSNNHRVLNVTVLGAAVPDTTPPTPTISSPGLSDGDATGTSPIMFTVTFDEAVTDFGQDDVRLGGTARPTLSDFTGPDGSSSYTFTASPGTGGTVTVDIRAGAAQDLASNPSVEAATFTVHYDAAGPVPKITTDAGRTTSSTPIDFSVSFDEPVADFAAGDVVLGGPAASGSSVDDFAGAGAGASYTFSVTPATAGGALTVEIPAGAVSDALGNANPRAAHYALTYVPAAPKVLSLKTGDLGTILITLSEVVTGVGTAGFAVSGVESGPGVSSATFSDKVITLGLTDTMLDSDRPRVAYNSTQGSIVDADLIPLAGFERAVANDLDTTNPAVRSAVVRGSGEIVVSFSERVTGTTGSGDWTLSGSPAGLAVNTTTLQHGSSSVRLGLSGDIPDDKPELTLAYGGSGIKDLAGSGFENRVGNLLKPDSGIPVRYPSFSGKSLESPVPILDIRSVMASYPQYVPKEIRDAAASGGSGKHDPDSPIPPMTAGGTFGFPLEINGYGYLLGGAKNTLEPQTILAGHNVTISFTVYDRVPIVHFTLYMNLHGPDDQYSDSDTHVRYDAGTIQIVDPRGLIESAAVTIQTDGDRQVITFEITFAGEMDLTNMAARMWNADLSLLTVQVLDAFEVVTEAVVDPEPTAPGVDPEPVITIGPVTDPEPTLDEMAAVRMWSGFESFVLDDAGLLAALGLDYPGADIPGWMMTELGPLVVKGGITIDEFVTALEYVLLEGAT